MGSSTTTQTSQSTPTPQEQTLMNQQIQNNAFMQPIAQQTYSNLSDNINAILTGQTPMAKGIGGITDDQTQSMVNQSLRDIMPQFQSSGILNSGEAAQVANLTAAQTRNSNAQFNVSAAQNLFNLASGGQSALQGQQQASTNNLSNELAGLRTSNSSQTQFANPFTQAFAGISAVGDLAKGLGSMGVGASVGSCWVAAEVFDGWSDVRTNIARFYIMFHAPKWFRNMYMKFGRNIANFIHNKPILKNMIKPLFESFVVKGKEKLNGR